MNCLCKETFKRGDRILSSSLLMLTLVTFPVSFKTEDVLDETKSWKSWKLSRNSQLPTEILTML